MLISSSDVQVFLKRFAPAGFSAQQAEAMVKILVRMTQANMEVIYGDMATKVHQVRCEPGPASLPSRGRL